MRKRPFVSDEAVGKDGLGGEGAGRVQCSLTTTKLKGSNYGLGER